MSETNDNLILDEFCQYEPTNEDDDFMVFNYKMLESHICYERVNKPMNDVKQWYIFTFGVGQQHAGHYVKFFGTYAEARQQMIDKYGLSWGFQYSEAEWNDWLQRKPAWIPAERELK